jgi:hypothetical protein
MPTLPLAILWLLSCAYINCAGWILAALHQLNPAGYTVALLLGVGFALIWWRKHPPVGSQARFARRCRRPLPAVFFCLAGLIFLGGAGYAPTNYDALTYRLPRMLNWLAAGQWYWIPTINDRMNYSGAAWEWTALPLLVLTRSDRFLFMLNFSGFLLLPGLMFSLFRQLGVGRRVAATWMWVLPLAYGYATQAGSIGNDLLGTVFCLLSLCLGLRARRSQQVTDVWFALLAAALMTGVKLSNLPLVLPCLVAVGPALRQLQKQVWLGLLVAATALIISAAPIMALNQLHTGGWNGDPFNRSRLQARNPVAAVLGNSLLVAEQTLMPPIFPAARQINLRINQGLPAAWSSLLDRDFPRFQSSQLNELPAEEGAGLGLGVTGLLLAGLAATLWHWVKGGSRLRLRLPGVTIAAWAAGSIYLLKMGSEAAARLMLPYYPLMLVPFLLLPGQNWLLKFRGGRICAQLAALSILPALVLSPLRPLWPGGMMCRRLAAEHPGQRLIQRMAATYSAYASRNDLLAPLRSALPGNVREIGFIAGSNDTDYSLWRPFGRRRVVYLCQDRQQFVTHPDAVEWLVVKEKDWPIISGTPLREWEQTNHFRVVLSTNIVTLVSWGNETWSLLHHEK